MGLVHEDQEVVGEVVEQGRRRVSRGALGEVTRVVLDAGAAPHLFEHFDVEHGALLESLGLEEFRLGAQRLQSIVKFVYRPRCNCCRDHRRDFCL